MKKFTEMTLPELKEFIGKMDEGLVEPDFPMDVEQWDALVQARIDMMPDEE